MAGEQNRPDWQGLLDEALTAPGNLTGVYDRFHDYRLTNMLLFRLQGIHEPVASFSRWRSLGRHVTRIADELGTGLEAVAIYRHIMCLKLGIKQEELAAYARGHHLAPDESCMFD